jgi:predicted membrane protein
MVFRIWLGSILIILGAGAMADQIYAFNFWHWVSLLWPLAVILLGVLFLVTRSTTLLGSTILLALGVLMEISALGLAGRNFWELLWPSLIILAGLYMVFWMGHRTGPVAASGDLMQHFVLFSGLETRHTNDHFRGGNVFTAFGGSEIDLRDATLAPEGAQMELTAAFGGITIIVPQSWKLHISGLPLFGGWSDKTRNSSSAGGPEVVIRCLAMFGGIDIKN